MKSGGVADATLALLTGGSRNHPSGCSHSSRIPRSSHLSVEALPACVQALSQPGPEGARRGQGDAALENCRTLVLTTWREGVLVISCVYRLMSTMSSRVLCLWLQGSGDSLGNWAGLNTFLVFSL